MKRNRQLSLILAMLVILVFFAGMFMISQNFANGRYVVYAGMILGGLYWIWTIIMVISTDDLKRYQKTFWLIIVITLPLFGGLIYGILHQRRNKIAA